MQMEIVQSPSPLFAIVEALEQWRHYISYLTDTVVVKTDH
jgi:hypothetical protein